MGLITVVKRIGNGTRSSGVKNMRKHETNSRFECLRVFFVEVVGPFEEIRKVPGTPGK